MSSILEKNQNRSQPSDAFQTPPMPEARFNIMERSIVYHITPTSIVCERCNSIKEAMEIISTKIPQKLNYL